MIKKHDNNFYKVAKLCLLLYLFLLIVVSGAEAASKNFKVTVKPHKFDLNNPPEPDGNASIITGIGINPFDLNLSHTSPILPPSPQGSDWDDPTAPGYLNVSMNAPRTVIIEIKGEDLASFHWNDVVIPVAIEFLVPPGTKAKGVSMSFLDKSGREELATVEVDPDSYHTAGEYSSIGNSRSLYYKDFPAGVREIFGMTDYWDMTWFKNLPKCSMVYDFWVTVRGMESKRKTFILNFYVDGQKITQDNFEKMAEKYPALKEKPGK